MKDNKFKYQSVHDYLDEVLSENSSHAEIRNAKRAYWRMYNTNLKKERRLALKHINLALGNAEYKQLSHLAKDSGETLFNYIRAVSLQPAPFRIPSRAIRRLEELSLKLQDLFEEMRDEELLNDSNADNISTACDNLHTQIVMLKNKIS